MNKIKITSIIMTTILISVTMASLTGAEAVLEGDIEAEILPEASWLGVIKSKINLTENQTVNLGVTVNEIDDVSPFSNVKVLIIFTQILINLITKDL